MSSVDERDRPEIEIVLARAIYDALDIPNVHGDPFLGRFNLEGKVTVDGAFNFSAVAEFVSQRLSEGFDIRPKAT
jgi:hypothetical protein